MKPSWIGIVVHHTDSHNVTISTIRKWHKSRGWDDVGYHFLIRADGSIQEGMPLSRAGYHAYGRNHTHIGIAFTGCYSGKAKNKKALIEPTDAQIISFINLIRRLKHQFNISASKIEKHHANCPGDRFPFEEIMSRISTNTRISKASQVISDIQSKLKTLGTILNA